MTKKIEETFPLLAVKLKEPHRDFKAGTILLWIHNTTHDRYELHYDRCISYYTKKEIEKIGEFVDESQAEELITQILESPNHMPQAPTLELHVDTLPEPDKNQEEPQGQETSKELATTANKRSIGVLRNQALAFSRKAEDFQKTIEHHRAVLDQHGTARKGQLDLQSKNLQLQMKEMERQMQRMSHAIHTINLYLGQGEEVILIKTGEKAPTNSPITIRQRILAMDEEAIFLDHAGIDAQRITCFDRFLKETNLIEKILPEPKGIVVMQVTAEAYKYSHQHVDPLTAAQLNEENAKTYWIIRNGECIWRFWCGLEMGEKLFPNQGQIQSEVSRHAPGTDGYRKDLETAEGTQMTYLKAGLVIQGIIDRTLVLGPFPEGIRPQITNPATWPGKLQLIEDDGAFLLEEGHPSYYEWIRKTNGQLEAGQRVIVYKADKEDIHPRGAEGYNHGQALTVTKGSHGTFHAAFERTDEIWDKYDGLRPAKTKGSIRLQSNSCDWINVDNFNPEEATPYLRSRSNREHYRTMVPLLTRAIKLKQEEEKIEAPFLNLLIAEIKKKEPESDGALAKKLIQWWKTKNRLHRPLVQGEKETNLAWKEILREIETTSRKNQEPDSLPENLPENVVLAVRKDEKTLLVFIPEEPEVPYFVTQQTWRKIRGKWELKDSQPHQTIKKMDRHHDRPIENKEWLKAQKEVSPHRLPITQIQNTDFTPFLEKEDTLAIYLEVCKGKQLSQSILLAKKPDRHSHHLRTRLLIFDKGTWQERWGHSGICSTVEEALQTPQITKGTTLENQWRTNTILAVNTENLQAYHKEQRKIQRERKAQEKNRLYVRKCASSLREALVTKWKEKELIQFQAEGGNLEFFEDHLRTLHQPTYDLNPFENILEKALEKTTIANLPGKTIREIETLTQQNPKESPLLPEWFTLPPA